MALRILKKLDSQERYPKSKYPSIIKTQIGDVGSKTTYRQGKECLCLPFIINNCLDVIADSDLPRGKMVGVLTKRI
jgi:hypothetical protein